MENYRRVEAFYSGQVQGVGFRFQVQGIARPLDVVGFVRNLEDGRVQIIAEGEKDELVLFLRDIDQKLSTYVRQKTVSWQKPSHHFSSFEIRSSSIE